MSNTLDTSPAFDLAAAPLRIARVRLKVRDLGRVSRFYREIAGLQALDGDAVLGTWAGPILELVGDPGLAARDPRAAGLFHTAFLLPGRADLGRWLAHAHDRGVTLDGAADHAVSEALYLSDPEGNGVEIYADRPPARWKTGGDGYVLTNDPLDFDDLLRQASGRPWTGMPEASVVGHVHLQVGDLAAAERFYGDLLGLHVTCRYPAARFFGAGGYHHQLAANTWNSAGAGARPAQVAGLDEIRIAVNPATRAAVEARARATGVPLANAGDATTLRDPWGTAITMADA